MKAVQTLVLLSLVIAPYTMAQKALAFDFPKEAYVAKYDVTFPPDGKMEMVMGSDGKGMTFIKTTEGNKVTRDYFDYKTTTKTTFDDTRKQALISKMYEEDANFFDQDRYKRKGSKELGSKTVAGHQCHGFVFEQGGKSADVWIANDCKVMVSTETSGQDAKTIILLKELNKEPNSKEFKIEIPSDYQTVSMLETTTQKTGEQ